MEEDEKYLKEWKVEIKPDRRTRRLIKAYERDIPAQRVEIVKLKAELESLKAKEIQTNKKRNTTRLITWKWKFTLKKEILEIELKLKEANRER